MVSSVITSIGIFFPAEVLTIIGKTDEDVIKSNVVPLVILLQSLTTCSGTRSCLSREIPEKKE
jgi:hypothetical protein